MQHHRIALISCFPSTSTDMKDRESSLSPPKIGFRREQDR